MNYETFTKLVLEAKVNKIYKLPENFRYKSMKIDFIENEYLWVLERNYRVTGSTGYVFPMKTGRMVKTFKTEEGAKRNLIKWITFCFEVI
jgi:hypothetical protein